MSEAPKTIGATELRRFEPYPAYKDTGAEWMGRIPSHWATKPLKRLARLRAGIAITSESINEVGDYPVFGGNGIRGFTSSYTHEGEYPLIGRQGALCGVVNFANGKFWASEHAVVAAPEQGVHPRWLAYLLHAMSLNSYSESAAQPGLAVNSISALRVPEPTALEQHSIVSFLDREKAKIDALVTKKERLIELLQEKRSGLITRAVTRGLDPNVPVKDSGVEWLGEIPAHWEVKPLKHLVPHITVGIVVTPAKYYVDEGVPCLRSLNIAHGNVSMADLVFISPEANQLHWKSQIFEGDLVVVRTGKAGAAAIVPRELNGANCIDLLIIRRSKSLYSRFLYHFINSTATSAQVEAHSVGAIQEHYNTGTLANLNVPEIPLREQKLIAEYLDSETGQIDQLAAEINQAIDRLKEFRIALISAAVTGKIDVREEAA